MKDRGAATVEELYLRFDCFLLPLERPEIQQVLESARREGLVAEVPDEKDGYGEKVADQWTTTEKGEKLGRPRTLALPDLGYLLFGEHDRVVKTFDVAKTALTALIPVIALLGIDTLDPGTTAKWVGFGAVGAAIVWMAGYALRGELDLRAAAASWARLKEKRRERWDYQMSWPCMVFLPGIIGIAYVAAGLYLAFGFFDRWELVAIAAVAIVVSIYLSVVFPQIPRLAQGGP